MHYALKLAERARQADAVPVGAIVLSADGDVVSEGWNTLRGPLDHAECVAIDLAVKKLGSNKLRGCTIYTTLEPCIMCAGAILNAQIDKVVFGAWDTRFGASGSVWDLLRDPRAAHHPEVFGGVLDEECSKILTDFFEELR
ncbi:tRNA-specific adenosine deaminase [Actinomycetota bacterium]|nr:tRNA-specific adenosine deaminase [Actinomycetota bacterium]